MNDDLTYIIYELIDILQRINFGYDYIDVNNKILSLIDYLNNIEKKDRD